MEAFLTHGPGELPRGTPYRLHDDLRLAVWRAYELAENPLATRPEDVWVRKWREVVLALPKGAAKSELGGAVLMLEGLGPVRFGGWDASGDPVGVPVGSADLLVLATSLEQADRTTFANVAYMADPANVRDEFLEEYGPCDVGRSWETSTRVIFPDGRGACEAQSAADAKSEGGKETVVVFEEPHEWLTDRMHSLHRRVSRNMAKRPNTLGLHLTNWFDPDEDSLLKSTVEAVEAGLLPEVLLIANHVPPHLRIPRDIELRDCSDARLLKALKAVYGSATFVPLRSILQIIRDPRQPDHESRRYYCNETARAATGKGWVQPTQWDKHKSSLGLEDGQQVWAAVDSALNRDSAAVVWGGWVDDRLVVRARIWSAAEGRIPRDEMRQQIRDLAARYELVLANYDPRFFEEAGGDLADEGYPMVEFPQSIERLSPACGDTMDAILSGVIAHDGADDLRDHVLAARQKFNERGFTLSKQKAGGQKIDGAVALCMMAVAALRHEPGPLIEGPSVYEERGVVWLE